LAEFSSSASGAQSQSLSNLEDAIKKFLVPSPKSTSSVGICAPKICSARDLTKLGNTYLNDFGLKWKVHHCEKPLSFGLIEILVM
jgi:hypothetical protein